MPAHPFGEKEPCGTLAAYRRHRYNNEPVCLPCRKANASRSRSFRAKVKAKLCRICSGAAEPTGWQPGFVVDVSGLLDYCEAIEPEWDREAAMGDAF